MEQQVREQYLDAPAAGEAGLYVSRWVDERLRRYAALLMFGGSDALGQVIRDDQQATNARARRLGPREFRPDVLVVDEAGRERGYDHWNFQHLRKNTRRRHAQPYGFERARRTTALSTR